MNTTAEAVTTPTEYDPAADPGAMPRHRLRIKLRRPGVPLSIAQDDLTADQIAHDRAYVVAERTADRMQTAADVSAKLEQASDDDVNAVAALLAEGLAAMLEDADELPAVLVEGWRGGVVSIEYLTRCTVYLQTVQDGVASAGEG